MADISLVRWSWPHAVLARVRDPCHARMALPLCDMSVGLGVFETRRADSGQAAGLGVTRVRGEAELAEALLSPVLG
ncbi:MAG: hypothetical protein ABSC06_17370 [Rhodopila sp.]